MELVRAYAGALGVRPSTVVQRAAQVGGVAWAKWEAGDGSPTLRTADKIMKYMEENPVPMSPSDAGIEAYEPIERAS